MLRFSSPLDQVRIAAPCSADWDQMVGTDRVRFCGQCNLNVYNLSELSKAEAEAFIASNEGRLCVRFYRRADGSILTRNCPVGLHAVRRRLSRMAQAASAAVIGCLSGLGIYAGRETFNAAHTMGTIRAYPRVNAPVIMGDAVKATIPTEPVIPRGELPVMGRLVIKSQPRTSSSQRPGVPRIDADTR